MHDTKKCPKCSLVLPRTDFYVVKTKTKKGWRYSSDCKSCQSSSVKQWKIDNPDKHQTNSKKGILKHRYNITLEEWQALLDKQNGLCAICSMDISDKPYVDHSHETGKVRGMLCNNCNRGIGMLQDSPESLQKASNYLLTNK